MHAFVQAVYVDDSEVSAFKSIQQHLEEQTFMKDTNLGLLEMNMQAQRTVSFLSVVNHCI